MQGKTDILFRLIRTDLAADLKKSRSFFLLGPRQVGKTTLIRDLLREMPETMAFSLQNPKVRLAFERDPGLLIRRVGAAKTRTTVFIDEVQKVPELLDAVQLLVDEKKANFVLTGSSARKLKRAGTNLLPGRVKAFHLDPLSWSELGWAGENRVEPLAVPRADGSVEYTLEESMAFGTLPGIVTLKGGKDRREFLHAYAQMYLEEEIRAESLTRKIGAFSRFLELAAQESGTSPNFAKLSMEAGVSAPAIREFFNLLHETLVVERVEPFMRNARKRILSTPRFYFFDLGVRNALARLPMEPAAVRSQKGLLFEHAVVLELLRRIRILKKDFRLNFWRTSGGAEVDCVIDMGSEVIPIEIKAAKRVRLGELKGLKNFLEDYRPLAREGYVITMGDSAERLADNILCIPWRDL